MLGVHEPGGFSAIAYGVAARISGGKGASSSAAPYWRGRHSAKAV